MRDPDVLKATSREGLGELTAVTMKAARLPVKAAVLVRMNPKVEAGHAFIPTGHIVPAGDTAQIAIAQAAIIQIAIIRTTVVLIISTITTEGITVPVMERKEKGRKDLIARTTTVRVDIIQTTDVLVDIVPVDIVPTVTIPIVARAATAPMVTIPSAVLTAIIQTIVRTDIVPTVRATDTGLAANTTTAVHMNASLSGNVSANRYPSLFLQSRRTRTLSV
jgi:hypothetical protein